MTDTLEIEVAKLGQEVKDLSARVERGFLEIRDNTVSKIQTLEKDKADKDEVEKVRRVLDDNHEIRIRKVENKLVYVFAWATGAGAIVGVILQYFINKH